MTDPEYNRLSKNVSEMALEKHDAWRKYAELNRHKIDGAVDQPQLDAAFDACQLWDERLEAAVHALWEYRDRKKQGRRKEA